MNDDHVIKLQGVIIKRNIHKYNEIVVIVYVAKLEIANMTTTNNVIFCGIKDINVSNTVIIASCFSILDRVFLSCRLLVFDNFWEVRVQYSM